MRQKLQRALERSNRLATHPEYQRCAADPAHFLRAYCRIYDATEKVWIPFALWDSQLPVLEAFEHERLVVVLKSRQLGLTWLALAYALWQMLFQPIATVMIFSRRDAEAVYLLSKERLRGMLEALPDWLKPAATPVKDSGHTLALSNGSIAYAFPTTAGDSYTASLVICDEFDLVDKQNELIRAVKPTIDGGGKMFLISRANKALPNSEFKAIYRAAKAGTNGWRSVFLPWSARPTRDAAWYAAQEAEVLERTGGLDDLHEQYPATDVQALAPASLDKRLPAAWLEQCYREARPLLLDDLPPELAVIPGLRVYRLPHLKGQYVAGADCAEGLPNSDDSVTILVDKLTGEEVAVLAGKLTPAVHAAATVKLLLAYNRASVLPERNNHGHAFLQWLAENGHQARVQDGYDKRPGWNSNTLGKTLLYDGVAERLRCRDAALHDFVTMTQLQAVEQGTLRAPGGDHDDQADAFALAQVARSGPSGGGQFVH